MSPYNTHRDASKNVKGVNDYITSPIVVWREVWFEVLGARGLVKRKEGEGAKTKEKMQKIIK